jgi:thymidylate synthase (FAD)
MIKSAPRPHVPALDAMLGTAHQVLDHGFVRVIDYMGDDSSVVQAARVSYGSGTKSTRQDQGLINYLMQNRHTTPFEMCEIKFHIKLPIFIARQWIRHRTASVNEYSARYSVLDKEFYIPQIANIATQSTTNNQGRGDDAIDAERASQIQQLLRDDASRCYDNYTGLLEQDNLSRELARMNLNLNFYTQWYWKIDLHNLLHFLKLRADSHAQYEIRAYAKVMLEIVKQWVPLCYNAFVEHVLDAEQLSATMIQVLRRITKGEEISQEDSGLSKRNWAKLMRILGD